VDENTFWTNVWKIGTAGCVVGALVIGGCVANTHIQVSKDLRAGIDPVAVACAHGVDGATSACTILAAKK